MFEEELLRIEDFSAFFHQEKNVFQAVKKLNARIGRGEWVALVGESGSGKSVTALSILRLMEVPGMATEGIISYTTRSGKKLPLTEATILQENIRGKEIAMIFQEPMSSLNPLLTCGEQIMEAIIQNTTLSREKAREKTIALCGKVRLPDPEKIIAKYPHEISGGQKQRVMIAMAMSADPALLICDEPTTALDYDVQYAIIDLLKDLQRETGMGILFITHDLGLVEKTADTILVMYKGDLVEAGPADRIFEAPAHPYTKALLACRPALYPKGVPLPVISDFLDGKNKEETIESVPSFVPGKEKLISVENLSVTYNREKSIFGNKPLFKGVDNVSFDILKGETLGLSGPSGCGKTTLGRAVLNLIPPDPGSSVKFRGKETAHLSSRAWIPLRKKMQLIFQDPYASLNPSKTIGALIAEPLKVHGIFPDKQLRKERVLELLEAVQLPASAAEKFPHEFSGGQRQRISIARALALEPDFIVCDESVSALDVSVQAQVLNLLNDLKARFGLTLLFISHDREVVRYFCDRILFMEKGKLINTPTS